MIPLDREARDGAKRIGRSTEGGEMLDRLLDQRFSLAARAIGAEQRHERLLARAGILADPLAGLFLATFMIEQVVAAGPSLGVGRVSLNFAVFRDALERGERIGAGPILRAWRRVLLFASRWWQIESLYRFNVKFRPYWEPRFISFPSSRDLPRIAVAGLEAEAFLVRPHRLKRLLGRG